jgi:hypothetical protein
MTTRPTTQDLDSAVKAARGVKPQRAPQYCLLCDEPLVGVQLKVGLCWACQFRQESRDRRDYEEGA